MKGNIEKISAAAKKAGVDAVLITSVQNRFYATGFRSSAGELIITAEGPAALFIDGRYHEDAASKISGAEVLRAKTGEDYYVQLKEYLAANGVKTLAVEEGSLSYARYMTFKERLGVEFTAGQQLISSLRAIKTREELEVMIKAQRIAEKSFNELISVINMDMTEQDIAAELTCRMLKNGATDKSFPAIVVSGSLSSIPHGKPRGDVKLQRGFLTIDFGALYGGYCSDTTRTLCVGEPDKEMEKVYNTVLNAQLAAIDAAKAGMIGRELDGIARKVIADAGYGEYFTHSLSHGLGIDVHEAPNASPLAEGVLPAGAVISVEPGIYIPGKYGVRIEDVIYLTETGCEDLTELPKELTVICA